MTYDLWQWSCTPQTFFYRTPPVAASQNSFMWSIQSIVAALLIDPNSMYKNILCSSKLLHLCSFIQATPFSGLTLRLLSKFTCSRLKVAWEFLSNFLRHKGQLYVKLTIFLLLPVSTLNTMYTIKLCQKQLWRNVASVKLELRKITYLLGIQQIFFVLAF